jgi:prepilin-type processing-associated H-X9-DG protein
MPQPDEKRSDSGRPRQFRRWDIVACAVLLVVALGIFLPSVQRIRDGDGNRTQCVNNLRQIGLATLAVSTAYNKLPPAFGSFRDKPPAVKTPTGEQAHEASLFYFLLPHLEAAGAFSRLPPLFNYPDANQYVLAPDSPLGGLPDENAASIVIKPYVCPSEVSSDPSGIAQMSLTPGRTPPSPWGQNNYAANYLVFGMVKDARLPESVPDGLSVTIFFTEKAGSCDNSATGRRGGNLWAAPPFFPSDPKGLANYGGTIGYDPGETNPSKPYTMSLFQIRPVPGQCDPALAQSPHDGGINVSMGDGSVRFISAKVSPKTWSALLTPYPVRAENFPGGWQGRSDVVGEDWR